jgi:hypothetical protein
MCAQTCGQSIVLNVSFPFGQIHLKNDDMDFFDHWALIKMGNAKIARRAMETTDGTLTVGKLRMVRHPPNTYRPRGHSRLCPCRPWW